MKIGDLVTMSAKTIHVSEVEAIETWGAGLIIEQYDNGMLEVWWPKKNTTRSYGRHTNIIEVINEKD